MPLRPVGQSADLESPATTSAMLNDRKEELIGVKTEVLYLLILIRKFIFVKKNYVYFS